MNFGFSPINFNRFAPQNPESPGGALGYEVTRAVDAAPSHLIGGIRGGASGALSGVMWGAGIGAVAGAVGGPVGAAGGAVIGAGVGATVGVFKSLVDVSLKIVKVWQDLTKTSEALAKAYASFSPKLSRLADEFDRTQERINRKWANAIAPLTERIGREGMGFKERFEDLKIKIFKDFEPLLNMMVTWLAKIGDFSMRILEKLEPILKEIIKASAYFVAFVMDVVTLPSRNPGQLFQQWMTGSAPAGGVTPPAAPGATPTPTPPNVPGTPGGPTSSRPGPVLGPDGQPVAFADAGGGSAAAEAAAADQRAKDYARRRIATIVNRAKDHARPLTPAEYKEVQEAYAFLGEPMPEGMDTYKPDGTYADPPAEGPEGLLRRIAPHTMAVYDEYNKKKDERPLKSVTGVPSGWQDKYGIEHKFEKYAKGSHVRRREMPSLRPPRIARTDKADRPQDVVRSEKALEHIDQEIAALERKQQAGTLTDAEFDRLEHLYAMREKLAGDNEHVKRRRYGKGEPPKIPRGQANRNWQHQEGTPSGSGDTWTESGSVSVESRTTHSGSRESTTQPANTYKREAKEVPRGPGQGNTVNVHVGPAEEFENAIMEALRQLRHGLSNHDLHSMLQAFEIRNEAAYM